MRKIVIFVLFTIFVVFQTTTTNAEYNEENNIQKAILIETYIIKHKTRIENFVNKYNIQNSNYLKEDIKELNQSIVALNKIKNYEIKGKQSEDIIKAIVKRIKIINDNLKNNLNKEKDLFELNLKRKKDIYSRLGIKLSYKIDEINIKIAKTIIKLDKISESKKALIKNHLIKLNKESKKLKYFGNINFKSEKEIKDSFVRILNNIKREVKELRRSF